MKYSHKTSHRNITRPCVCRFPCHEAPMASNGGRAPLSRRYGPVWFAAQTEVAQGWQAGGEADGEARRGRASQAYSFLAPLQLQTARNQCVELSGRRRRVTYAFAPLLLASPPCFCLSVYCTGFAVCPPRYPLAIN